MEIREYYLKRTIIREAIGLIALVIWTMMAATMVKILATPTINEIVIFRSLHDIVGMLLALFGAAYISRHVSFRVLTMLDILGELTLVLIVLYMMLTVSDSDYIVAIIIYTYVIFRTVLNIPLARVSNSLEARVLSKETDTSLREVINNVKMTVRYIAVGVAGVTMIIIGVFVEDITTLILPMFIGNLIITTVELIVYIKYTRLIHHKIKDNSVGEHSNYGLYKSIKTIWEDKLN